MDDLPNHFFKFIPPGFKFNLSIPKSFLTNLAGWKCNTAILRREHHKWRVHITDGGVFGDGWRKFVIDNEVQELDFIVFKHQGNMVFDILVFEPSMCERQYPNMFNNVEEPVTESDSLHTHKMSKNLKKRNRTDYASKSKDDSGLGDDRCFVTIMTHCSISTPRLHIPMELARSNGLISEKMHTQVVLVDVAQRTWPATLIIKTDKISLTGWSELVINNDLEVGDVCMFELVKTGDVPVLNFFNLGKKPTNNHVQVKKETSSTIHKATPSTRYFISSLKQYSFKRSCLYLPVDFSESNDLRKGEMILRDDKGRLWKVELKKIGKKQFYLGCGFRDFSVANGLKEGDAYKFELFDNEKDKPPVVNFSYLGKNHIKRKTEIMETSSTINKADGSSLSNHPCKFVQAEKEKLGKPHIMNDSLNVDSTPAGQEDHMYYIGKVKSYYMYLPSEFVRANGLLNKEEMVLKTGNEMSWTADIRHNRNYCYIWRGWKEFCAANGLKEGDRFKLELVNAGEVPVFNIYNLGKKPAHSDIQVPQETSPTIKDPSSICYFTSTMKSYNFKKSYLYLPVGFSISNDLRIGEVILRDDKGTSWKVQLTKGSGNRFFLGSGLREFWVANGLREGDVYKFELVENEKDKPLIMNFSYVVTKLHETSSTIKKTGSTLIEKETGKPPIIRDSLKVNSTLSGIEDYPYYSGKLKSYHIENSLLYLPIEFARKNGLVNKEEMILKNFEERSWTVEIKLNMNKYCLVKGRGWKEFCVANGLKDGDLFKLVLVSNGEKPIAYFFNKLA